MIEIPSLRPETRYGISPADQLPFNRQSIVGYSYLFRQARWALEIIDAQSQMVVSNRLDGFRPDMRVPERFRASLADYSGSGFDCGHLVPSADRRATATLNSEPFLLSNMSPQAPNFNRQIWRKMETAVRDLAAKPEVVEVYALSGPLFEVGKEIMVIDGMDDDIDVVIPRRYFKCVLAEELKGKLTMWAFIFPNQGTRKPLEDFRVTTSEVEIRAGLPIWDRLRGGSAEALRNAIPDMW